MQCRDFLDTLTKNPDDNLRFIFITVLNPSRPEVYFMDGRVCMNSFNGNETIIFSDEMNLKNI